MASSYSFDVVSDFDQQEMRNAVDQAEREIQSRYDLKDSNTQIDLGADKIEIETDSEMSLNSIRDVLRNKAAKRGLSQKIFEGGRVEPAGGARVRQEVTLKRGIEKELAKQIVKQIKENAKKVQASIQGDAVRVSAKSKDDLQEVIQLLRQGDYPVDLQFENYR